MPKTEAAFRYARKLPCVECPFREGGFEFEPLRITGIVAQLVHDDMSGFACHKDVHHPKLGGEFDDEGNYIHSGKEAQCMGAMALLFAIGRPNVSTRIGLAMGQLSVDSLKQSQRMLKPLEDFGLDGEGRLLGSGAGSD